MQEQLTEEVQVVEPDKVDPLNNPKVNKAAYDFQNITKTIKKEVKGLSLRASHRLIAAIVEYPYLVDKRKLTKKEEEIFLYCLMAQQSKSIMNEALALSQDEIDNEVTSPIVEEIVADATNGGA